MKRIAAAAGWLLYGASLLFLVPGALLIAIHETVSGLLTGLLIVAALALPAVRAAARRWSAPAFRRTATLGLLGLILTLAVALFALAPPGTALPGAGIRSCVPAGQEYRQHRLWNLVPEIEQVKLAITLASFFDPFIDRSQARRILEWTLPLYREMEARPEFERLGSVLNLAYGDFLGLPATAVRHYYLVQPTPREGQPLPGVVFLHGAAGNFKVYPWLWRRFLEKRPVVAACPTFGFGNWERPGGVAVAEQVSLDLVKDGAADPDRIYLAALSNGGRAHPQGDHFLLLSALDEVLETIDSWMDDVERG